MHIVRRCNNWYEKRVNATNAVSNHVLFSTALAHCRWCRFKCAWCLFFCNDSRYSIGWLEFGHRAAVTRIECGEPRRAMIGERLCDINNLFCFYKWAQLYENFFLFCFYECVLCISCPLCAQACVFQLLFLLPYQITDMDQLLAKWYGSSPAITVTITESEHNIDGGRWWSKERTNNRTFDYSIP